jgi:hypothetical protein
MSEPIHIISLGAGVQSSTMALMAAKGQITPMPKCAIFADTQAEPLSVYKWLDWLEKELPFPVHRVSKGNMTEHALVIKERRDKTGYWSKNLVPAFILNTDGSRGILQRQCTYEYKVIPLEQAARRIAGIKRGQKTIGVVQWIGISRDEASRMKDSRVKWSSHRWPLIEMGLSRQDCLKWMQYNGYPKPPRSACVYCPYHSNKEWIRLRDEEPEEFGRAVKFESDLQAVKSRTERMQGVPFLHASLTPLGDVDFRTTLEKRGQLNMFENECEGMCGV